MSESENDALVQAHQEIADLRRKVDKLRRQQTPRADLSYVFVMTYGRSGSTLLTGLLNAIPGYLIRGENGDALRGLYDFHETCLEQSQRAPVERLRMKTNPFFGIGDYPAPLALQRIRGLALDTVLRPKAETRVSGFKEIRWWRGDIRPYAEWLREVFPGARFVVNTRDHDKVLKSKWWAKGDDKTEHLNDIEDRILAAAAELGDAAYRVHFDDWVNDPTTLRGLFEWLGEEFDEPTVRATLAKKHSV